nr:DUF1998 domain-containing protein [Nostocaceae cyanobacterium]
DGLFTPRSDRRANIIIYDNVPGGAGYSSRIADRFDEVLDTALKIVSSCNCATSCYDCLQTYSNQPFHNQLNRHLVADFLRRIVEQASPDEELQNFARNSYRVDLSGIDLTALCRSATSDTLIYLPQLIDKFGLDNVKNKSWLNRLTDIVYSLRSSNKPLELILNQIPELSAVPDSELDMRHHIKVCRKRLQQFIDQDLVKLYQASGEHFPENLARDVPTLCFNSIQSNRIALSLEQSTNNKPQVWFQTRSLEGVKAVFTRLEKLRQEARLVQVSELEDLNTSVIFLNPSEKEWCGYFSMLELRKKLGLEGALSESNIMKVVYSDRFLRVEGVKILAELFQSCVFGEHSQISILTTDKAYENDNSFRLRNNPCALKQEFTKLLNIPPLNDANITVDVKGVTVDFKRWSDSSVSDRYHGRYLEIYRQDGKKIVVIFDKGMDFLQSLQSKAGVKYSVKERTYVVVEKMNY